MLVDLLQVAFGLALLVGGGRLLVSGAARLAGLLGVPPLVIGLTVVAFGTSAPELAVNVSAALGDTADVAFGNVIGSNLANVGLILGLVALVHPLPVSSTILSREIPMMLLASVAALVMGLALDGDAASVGAGRYGRSEGIVLLLFFTIFLYYTIGDTIRTRGSDPLVEQAEAQRREARGRTWTSVLAIGLGLVGLVLGGQLTIDGAIGLAASLDVDRSIVGLTLVAVGTSLPELSTSLIAARRGEADLAIGNVVGSNLFNLLFVLATTACLREVPVPGGGVADLVAICLASVLLLVICSPFTRRGLARREGALLLLAYLGYVSARALL